VIPLRGEPIKPSPKLVATINDAVHLARMVLEKVEGDKWLCFTEPALSYSSLGSTESDSRKLM
jgi:hypothetical protein